MLWLAIAFILLLVLMSAAISLAFGLVHLLVTLAIAGFVGWLADMVVPGELPYGWLGAVVAGLVGGWIGLRLIGQVGPGLFGVPLIPSFVGAVILIAGYELLAKAMVRRQ